MGKADEGAEKHQLWVHCRLAGSHRACLLSGGLRQRHITLDDAQSLLKAGVVQQPGHTVAAISWSAHNDFLHCTQSLAQWRANSPIPTGLPKAWETDNTVHRHPML